MYTCFCVICGNNILSTNDTYRAKVEELASSGFTVSDVIEFCFGCDGTMFLITETKYTERHRPTSGLEV